MSTGNQLGDDFFDIPLVPQYKELNVDNDDAESEQFFRETNGARVPRLEKENLTPLALAGAMRELKIEPAEAGAPQPVTSSAVEDSSASVTQASVDPLNTEEITECIPKLAMFGYQKKPQRRSYEQRKQEMEAEKEKEVHKAAPRVPSRSRYAVTREDAPVLRPRHRSTSLADRQRQQSVERAPATQTRGRSPGPAVRPLPASSGPNSDRQRSVSRNSQERMAQTSYRAGSVERATGPSVPSVRAQNAIRSRTPSVSASTRAPLTGSRPQSSAPAGPTLGSRPQSLSLEPRPVRPPSPSLGAQPTQFTRHRSPSVGNRNRPASPAMGTRSLTSSQTNATQGPTRVSGVRVPAAKPPVRTATSRGTVSAANGIAAAGAAGAGASLRNKTRTTGPLRAPPRQTVPVSKPGPIRVPSKDNNLRATPRAPTSAARPAAAPTSAARSAANTPRARHFGGSEVRRPAVPRSSVIHGVTPQKTDVFKVGLRRYPVASGMTPVRPLSEPNDGIEPSNAEHRIAMRRERSDATIGEDRPNSQASGTSDGGRSRVRAAGGATPKPNVADVVNRLYQPRRPTGATPARSAARPVATGRTPTVTLPSSRRVMHTPKGMFGAVKQKVNVTRAPEVSASSEAQAPSSTVSSNVEVPDCHMTSYSIEQAMLFAFDKMVTKPSLSFSKVVVGFNCNVDVIVPGTRLIEQLNATTENAADRETVRNINELSEAFNYMFIRGAAAERYMADEESFATVVATAEKLQRMQYHIGGNAALMAEKIASGFPNTEAYLVGPIGPRSNALLHPSIKRTNSTRIVKDEVHVIMEYKQGEILGEHVAPSSSRFITSHDLFSGSSIVIDMFFKAISQFHPDLIIISGVHLLEFQGKEARAEKVAIIRRNLLQVSQRVPIHLELGSMGDPQHVKMVLEKIIPNVDSIGLTEQELAVICHVGGGPYTEEWPVQAGALHAHKVVDMLHWLLVKYGRHQERKPTGKVPNRLQRIHFKCLTFHIVVSVGTDWSNLAAGLAAGARISGRQACGASHADPDMLDLRVSQQFVLDSKLQKMYHFNSHEPVASWMRDDMVFIFTPVLVCKYPRKTVGIDDAVSTSALLFSQFFRSEHIVY